MGEVYRALDRTTRGLVAVKKLVHGNDVHADRFRREAEVLAGVAHPHVVRYLDEGRTASGELYLVMEWLEGRTLDRVLESRRLGWQESVELITRLADGLAVAHDQGVIHRDIKPSNVFVEGSKLDQVKLIDFGIARILRSTRPLTLTGKVVGTPGYMAPEQACGTPTVGPEVDVFALGCVLFECIAGRPVFCGEHVMAILAKLLLEEPPRLASICPEVPPPLGAVVDRMLAKAPADRFRDAGEVARALKSLVHGPAAAPPLRDLSRVAPIAMSGAERHFISVVAIAQPTTQEPRGLSTTLLQASSYPLIESVRRIVVPLGARAEVLLDGTILVVLSGAAHPKDQARHAARCALWAREATPGLALALVTGWGETSERVPVGDALERAAQLLAGAPPVESRGPRGVILLDRLTRALLDARFEVLEDEDRLLLRAERSLGEIPRTLLGRPSPFIGRQRDLRNVLELLEELLEERRPAAILVTAEAGMGKSRLRQELLSGLRKRQEELILAVGSGDMRGADSAFGLLGSVFRNALGIGDGEPLTQQREKLAILVELYVAPAERQRVLEFFGEFLRVPFDDTSSPQLRAARQSPRVMADQITAAYVDFAQAVATARPLVLVLEDLHWGDATSVHLVDTALRDLDDAQYVVVAFARPDVHRRFPRLWRGRRLHQIQLGPLPRRAAIELAQGVLGDRATDEQIESIVERAQGNALFLEELIRNVAGGGATSLPATILGMLEVRFASMSPDIRRFLRAASVFGEVFWESGVCELLGEVEPIDERDPRLRYLIDEEVVVRRIERRFAAQRELAFRHPVLREGIYATLTERDRSVGHRAAGEWLLRVGESDPGVLAEHLDRGGDNVRAASFYAQAADQAVLGSDYASAIRLGERGIALRPAPEVEAVLSSIVADARFWSRDYERSIEAAKTALVLTRSGSRSDCRTLGNMVAASLFHDGKRSDIQPYLDRLLTTDPESNAMVALFAGIHGSMLYLVSTEPIDEVKPFIDRLESLAARATDDIVARAWVELIRALWRRNVTAEPWVSLEHAKVAADLFQSAGYRRLLTLAYANVALDQVSVGNLSEGDVAIERAMAWARSSHVQTAIATYFSSISRWWKGDLVGAKEQAQEALGAAKERDDQLLAVLSRLVLAEVAVAQGAGLELVGKLRDLDRAALPFPYQRTWVLIVLAEVLLQGGRLEEAEQTLAEAEHLRDVLGRCHLARPSSLPALRARLFHAQGHRRAALESIRAAKAELQRRAACIVDPEARQRFLVNVPDNARILALERAWSG